MGPGQLVSAVDCHAHFAPATFVELLKSSAAHDPGLGHAAEWYGTKFAEQLPGPCTQFFFGPLADRIESLDAAGVGTQVISPGSMLAFPGTVQGRAEVVSAWNDAVHSEVETCGGRFAVFSGLPLPEIDAALAEIDRVLDRPYHVGFATTTHLNGVGLEDDRWTPVLERLSELRSVLFVHPDGFRVKGLLDRSLNIDLGTQLDDVLLAVALYSGLAEKYPGIRWVVCHLGGALPFLLERLDEHWERDRAVRTLRQAPSESLRNVFFDTAGHGPRATAYAVRALGAERLVFGTDFPMVLAEDYAHSLERALAEIDDPAVFRMVAEVNPRELLGIVPQR